MCGQRLCYFSCVEGGGDCSYLRVRASPAAPPTGPPQAILPRRRQKKAPVAPPEARFSPARAKTGAGGPRPNPAPWGALGEPAQAKKARGPALEATRGPFPAVS